MLERQRTLTRALLAGERARLRPLAIEDAEPAFALLAGQDEILRWLAWNGPRSVDELRDHYRTWNVESDEGDDYRFAIEDVATGELAGSLTVRFLGHPGTGDVGYWIGTPWWNRGLGSEAVALAAHLAFRHLAADALYAWVFVGNQRSRAILEKNGFELVRTAKARTMKQGRTHDDWYFACLSGNWQQRFADFRPVVEDVGFEEGESRGSRSQLERGP